MPYSKLTDLPDHVKKYPKKKQRQWMAVWNSVYEKTEDEGRAFAAANSVLSKKRLLASEISEYLEALDGDIADGDSEEVIKSLAESQALSRALRWLPEIQKRFRDAQEFAPTKRVFLTAIGKSAEEIGLDPEFSSKFYDFMRILGTKPSVLWEINDVQAAFAASNFLDSVSKLEKSLASAKKAADASAYSLFFPVNCENLWDLGCVKEALSDFEALEVAKSTLELDFFPVYLPYAHKMDKSLANLPLKVIKTAVDFESKRVIVGVVMVPDEEDLQGDVISAEEIEKSAHQYLLNGAVVGINHTNFPYGAARVVESYVSPQDLDFNGVVVKKGSWVLAVKVFDDELLARIDSGELTGFSVGGFAQRRELF